MEILFDTNERPTFNFVLERSSSDMISDSSGNERRNIMSFLMPQSLDNQGSMFYLDSINSVDDVERFLGDYHAAKNRILFLKN